MSNDTPNPWGTNDSDTAGDSSPRPSPWLPESNSDESQRPPRRSNVDDILKRGPFGPNLPKMPGGRRAWMWGGAAVLALWIASTSVHVLDETEVGVVTQLGSFARTAGPGISLTLPAPLETMQTISTRNQAMTIPSGGGILTGDGNIVNLAYTVRWGVKAPVRFAFQLDSPETAIRDAAESAMRATLANYTFDAAVGRGRTEIQQEVQRRLQDILDRYASGVAITDVSINDAAAPAEVRDAFNRVSVARSEAESAKNRSRAFAQESIQRARGAAAEFDALYAQYRLAPEVTRRRLYYETMEAVLQPAPKTVIDSRVVPYLPLAGAQAAATPAPAAAAPAQPAPQAGASR